MKTFVAVRNADGGATMPVEAVWRKLAGELRIAQTALLSVPRVGGLWKTWRSDSIKSTYVVLNGWNDSL